VAALSKESTKRATAPCCEFIATTERQLREVDPKPSDLPMVRVKSW
jgi:hypothetical protein